jgi:2-amino-4-hydroxy-6-hydroxymethyldihydropteridine diphosphokinase
MHVATIGLGANLPSRAGSPEATIQAAMEDLGAAGRVRTRSSLYQTEPMLYQQQLAFVNAVLQLETEMEPETLLEFLLGVERKYGRERASDTPKGPRRLDLDLLLVDGLVVQSPHLTLPHPELSQRRFVLAPLTEIAPELRHPLLDATMRELLARLPDEGPNRRDAVRKLSSLKELP